ncbi:MAG TPA: DinB family protein [Methylomirabilota bacterium]|nr:DinB family protein [Methylomirabilota bacterium]
MIASLGAFADYFEGVRRRTVHFARQVPPESIDWAPKAGEYTCGDIVRHLAASEAMFSGVVADSVWRYPGHERARGATLEAALSLLDAGHSAARAALARVPDAALNEERASLEPGARPIRAWRVLMAMCEHEVHHRSQLASYLTLMGVDAPDIFGLGVEDVERLTAVGAGRQG